MITPKDFQAMRLHQLRPERVSTVSPEEIQQATRPSTKMLLAIAATGKHLYQGTVPGSTKAHRRAANKRARAARRAAR